MTVENPPIAARADVGSLMPYTRCSLVVLALALSACASAPAARPNAAPASATAAPIGERRPLPLWSVESPDGRVSHVLGTFHAGVALGEVIPSEHLPALDGARVLIVEIDLANGDASALLSQRLLPPERDLSTIISAELWPRLVDALASTMPEPVLRRLPPWIAMAGLMARDAARFQSERTGANETAERAAPSALDAEVMAHARARGVVVSALETMEQQALMMDALPLPWVVSYIESALAGTEGESQPLRALMDAYVVGDEEQLEALVFDPEEIARSPEIFEALIYVRNERWVQPLESELARGGAFVAVGLAHVIGERGLLRLLEQRGYRATRLSAAR